MRSTLIKLVLGLPVLFQQLISQTISKISLMLHQNLLQKQQGKILPQQIQLLNLFHLNTIQTMKQRLKNLIRKRFRITRIGKNMDTMTGRIIQMNMPAT